MEKPSKATKHNRQYAGSRLVVRAAFFLAIVSCFTTAQGIRLFVFSDADDTLSSIFAGLISFAIQTILFVLNLNFIGYFHRLIVKCKSISSKVARILCCAVFIGASIGILFASSWFSFVHFSEAAHKSTKPSVSAKAINNCIAESLDLAESKCNEYKAKALDSVNTSIAAVQFDSGNNPITGHSFVDGLGIDYAEPDNWVEGYDEYENRMRINKSEQNGENLPKETTLTPELSSIQEYVKRCGATMDDISSYHSLIQKMAEYDKSVADVDAVEKAYADDYNKYRNNYSDKGYDIIIRTKKDKKNSIKPEVKTLFQELKKELLALEPLSKASLAKALLSESLKPNPNANNMVKSLETMIETALNSCITDKNFAKFVTNMQAVSANTVQYQKLIAIQASSDENAVSINSLRNITISIPKSKDDSAWRNYCREKLEDTISLLRNINYYAASINDDDPALTDQIKEIEDVIHRHTDNLNTMEYVFEMLCERDFLSIFTLLLAFLIDLVAVFAGVFAKLSAPSESKKTQKQETATV